MMYDEAQARKKQIAKQREEFANDGELYPVENVSGKGSVHNVICLLS